MTIKVKHILLVIIITIVVIILYRCLKKPVKEMFVKKYYENEIIEYLNLNKNKNLDDGKIWDYEYYKNYFNESDIDISPLIESYIKQIETNEKNLYNVGGYEVSLQSDVRRSIEALDYTYITYVFYGDNRKATISELEKVLIHKSSDKYKDWYILKNSPKIIDLPYNYYLEYEPSDFRLLDNVKKVTKCSFVDPVTYGGNRKRIKIEYIDKNECIYSDDRTIIIEDNNIITSLSGLYYNETHKAKIELKNHDYDEWLKEKEKEEETAPWNQDQSYLISDYIE